MNDYKIDGRKIQVSLAQQKEQYEKNPIISNIDEQIPSKTLPGVLNVSKSQSLLNDPKRTLFIRNLGFMVTQEKLKEFFEKFGRVVYAKIVKDKETGASKGTGFVMFNNEKDVDILMDLYKKYDTNNTGSKSNYDINPFELEERSLKLLRSVSKDEAIKMDKHNNNKNSSDIDTRNRKLLYYGLSNIKELENSENITEEDMEKREELIQYKKTNFKKNTNLHVSETRITIRNLDKSTDEEKLKVIIRKCLDDYIGISCDDDKKKYNKIKKIKQIKVLRDANQLDKDDEPKSKCVAFVEVCDVHIAKALINRLSNMKLNKRRGLIVEFALDDIRKLHKRQLKMGNKRTVTVKKERKEKRKNTSEEVIITIDTIKDIDTLLEIYKNTISRGKKQRVKKRLLKLNYDVDKLEHENDQKKKKDRPVKIENKNEYYVTRKIENDKTNINKKTREMNKNEKKNNYNNNNNNNDNNDNYSESVLKKKRKRNDSRTPVTGQQDEEDNFEDDMDMNPYYARIMENLKRKSG